MHLDAEQVQRLLHGEIVEDASRVHVAECAACRARIDEAKREEDMVFGLLRHLDRAAPSLSAPTVIARAQGRTMGRRLRWAAVVVLGLTVVGVAYAAPGSPLREVVARVAGWLKREQAPEVDPGAGVVVLPSARFRIEFTGAHPAGTVTVSLTDGPSIVARRLNGNASFTSDVDRLSIAAGDTAGVYEIELPRHAPWVEILAGGRRLFLKDGARIETTAAPGTAGRYSLPLGP